jgi:outer membrane protein TolC
MLGKNSIQNSIQISAMLAFSLWGLTFAPLANALLVLRDAELMALNNAPEIKQLDAKRHMLEEEAIADGQYPDPNLTVNLSNMPVDTFDFTQEPMTQIQLGLQQSFPKGKSLKYAKNRKTHLAFVAEHNTSLAALNILRDVRLAWLDLLYWNQVTEKTKEQRSIFENLRDITQSLLGNNIAQQHDVIRAQLELIELDNRLIELNKNTALAKANLKRWLGYTRPQAYSAGEPVLPELKSYQTLVHDLAHHPILLADRENVASHQDNIKWFCEQYKPGMTAGVVYGIRQGRNNDHSKRADFVSATLKMDLPIFGGNRQSRRISASQDTLIASQEKEEIDYRVLLEALDSQHANLQEYSRQLTLYTGRLVPHAKQYAQATLLAYKNGTSDFPTLALSHVTELNTKIGAIKARVEREKAHVQLLFIQGNEHG